MTTRTDADTSAEAAELRRLFASVSNWGRWGPNDGAGTLNLIGPTERRRAAAAITQGVSIGCAREISTTATSLDLNPAQWALLRGGDAAPDTGVGVATDRLTIAPHGGSFTHLDALCHVSFDGQTYNGRPAADVRSTQIGSNDLTPTFDGIVSRGVLLDIPGLRGTDYVSIDDPISAAELDAAERACRVRVQPGDILVVSAGREARAAAEGLESEHINGQWTMPGMGADCLPWLRERDVGLLISDGGSDPLPRRGPYLPIHVGALVFLGMPLIDNASLAALTNHARETQQWHFSMTVAPQRCPGTTGAAVNPIAVF